MWLFTKYGFFSVVCARQGDGEHGQPVDPQRMMIRARLESHLIALQNRFPELLGTIPVQQSKRTDYAFRLFVPKPVWMDIVSQLAEEMDFDNFKSEVAEFQGGKGAAYVHALHNVWGVMANLQKA
jgi:hypothetical protein